MNAALREHTADSVLDEYREHRERLAVLTAERGALDEKFAGIVAAIDDVKAPQEALDNLREKQKAVLGARFLGQSKDGELNEINSQVEAAEKTVKAAQATAAAAQAANVILQEQIGEQHRRYLEELALAPPIKASYLAYRQKEALKPYEQASRDLAKAYLELSALVEAGVTLNVGLSRKWAPIGPGTLLEARLSMPFQMPNFAGLLPPDLLGAIATRKDAILAELQQA